MAFLGRLSNCFGIARTVSSTEETAVAQSQADAPGTPQDPRPQAQGRTAGDAARTLLPRRPSARTNVSATPLVTVGSGAVPATPRITAPGAFVPAQSTTRDFVRLLSRHGVAHLPTLTADQRLAVTQALQTLNGEHASFETTRDNMRMAIELGHPARYAAAMTLLRCGLVSANHVRPDVHLWPLPADIAALMKDNDEYFFKPDRSLYLKSDGDTFLHALAVMADDAEIGVGRDYGFKPVPTRQRIDDLVACGAELNVRNRKGETPLEAALFINPNREAIAARLIAHGADPFALDERGHTLLHRAISSGNAEVAAALLKGLPNASTRIYYVNGRALPDQRTPIEVACGAVKDRTARRAILKLLMENGAKPRHCDIALFRAIRDNDHDVVDDLLAAGLCESIAEMRLPQHPLHRPLRSAAKHGNDPKIIATLMAHGAPWEDVTVAADDITFGIGPSAIHEAARYNTNPAIADALIAGGADPNHVSLFGHDSCMHVAASHNPNPVVLATLLEKGGRVNARGNRNRTPLHAAVNLSAARYMPEKVAILLAAGADATLTDNLGRTAREVADSAGLVWPGK